jgi:hypothetical protein
MTQAKIDALPADQQRALQSLAERQPDVDSGFINIAAGQALTALGLARRGRAGWEITPQGRNHLLRTTATETPETETPDASAPINLR